MIRCKHKIFGAGSIIGAVENGFIIKFDNLATFRTIKTEFVVLLQEAA